MIIYLQTPSGSAMPCEAQFVELLDKPGICGRIVPYDELIRENPENGTYFMGGSL